MADPKAFILHLERATQRRPQVERLSAALPAPSEILAAVDGAALSAREVEAIYTRAKFRPRYPFALVRAEIGAFLSHRRAWERIVAENLDFGLIFEDDADLDGKGFAKTYAAALRTRSLWDYALLPAPSTRVAGKTLASEGEIALVRPNNPPLRAIGQFVSRQAAARLLAATTVFDRPVDTFLQMSWVTGQELLAFVPSGLRDASTTIGGTTVGRKAMGLADKIAHEAARPIYRANVFVWHKLFGKQAG